MASSKFFFSKIPSIQVIRFFAVFFVIITHAISRAMRLYPNHVVEQSFLYKGAVLSHIGVDLFFIISGFIMITTQYENFGNWKNILIFLKKRVIRIVPLYWILSSLALFLLTFFPYLFSFGQKPQLLWALSSFLFLPATSSAGDVFSPILGLGWTLNYEMYFYIIFGLILIMPRYLAISFITLFFLASAMLSTFFEFSSPFLIQSTSWILLEFILGIFLGLLYKKNVKLPKLIGLSLIVLGSILIIITPLFLPDITSFKNLEYGLHTFRFLFWGIPSAITISGFIFSFPYFLAGTWLEKLGNASYSLYLIQAFSLPATGLLLKKYMHMNLDSNVFISLLTLCTLCLGYTLYIYLEKPLTSYLTKKLL